MKKHTRISIRPCCTCRTHTEFIGSDSEVTDPSTEAETECSPSEPACAESESNSHPSSELTDSAIDESEIQSPTSRTRGITFIIIFRIGFAITLVTLKLNVLLDEEKTPG
ncbi:hypothetical protein BC332_34814 [Capsicum chinense]|nr:hypothetical protein BC332_34814 [Capsicum chinense]